MKKEIKISLLSVLCGVCAAAFSPAFAAPAVRSLGGAGTYSGVTSATAAKTNGAAAKTVRASAVRNTAANLGSVKTTTGSTSTRAASTPRLSIGKYLGGAVTAGGSTISKGDSVSGELAGNVDNLNQAIEVLQKQIVDLHQSFVAAADDENNAGFIIADDEPGKDGFKFELSVPTLVDHIKDDLSGQLGADVEMRHDTATGYIQYKDAEGNWVDLVVIPEMAGLDEMAASLADLESRLNNIVIPDVSGFLTADDLTDMENRLGKVESAVAGELQTEAKTIVAAINELKGKADAALTEENLDTLNQAVQSLDGEMEGLVGVVLGTESTGGLVGAVQEMGDALEGKIPKPSAGCGQDMICVLTYDGAEYKWVELQLPVEPK